MKLTIEKQPPDAVQTFFSAPLTSTQLKIVDTAVRESKIETAVVAFAKKNGIKTYKMSGPGDRGKPDRIFLKDGRTVFMELKATGEKPRELQAKELRELRDLGFIAEYFDNIEKACAFLTLKFGL